MTEPAPKQKNNTLMTVAISVVTTIVVVFLIHAWLFPSAFSPVTLSSKEKVTLDSKVHALGIEIGEPVKVDTPKGELVPEKYTETNASHQITFTEREINALVANGNADLASRVAIDLSPDLVSAKALVPLDPELPIVGGKILRISAGLELKFGDRRPIVILKGVTVWGVAIPNSWLGNLKNVDLVHEFGDAGFWKAFSEGVEDIKVGDGTITVKLKE
ncbi:MAG: arginine N-succinyltransferase [Alphaproteobacteria bacterium]